MHITTRAQATSGEHSDGPGPSGGRNCPAHHPRLLHGAGLGGAVLRPPRLLVPRRLLRKPRQATWRTTLAGRLDPRRTCRGRSVCSAHQECSTCFCRPGRCCPPPGSCPHPGQPPLNPRMVPMRVVQRTSRTPRPAACRSCFLPSRWRPAWRERARAVRKAGLEDVTTSGGALSSRKAPDGTRDHASFRHGSNRGTGGRHWCFHQATTALLADLAGDRPGAIDWSAIAVVLHGATAHYWLFTDLFGRHPTGGRPGPLRRRPGALAVAVISGTLPSRKVPTETAETVRGRPETSKET